jgi:FkbM family methyltransferase
MSLRTKWAGFREMLLFDNWRQLIVDRALFGSSLMIYEFKGMELIADHEGGDAVGLRAVLVSGMYDQWLNKMTLPSEVCIADFGANCGAFPVLVRSAGIVIRCALCVEMNPNTFARLEFNMRRNFPEHSVLCENCAIAGKSGHLELYFGAGSTSDSIKGCTAVAGERRKSTVTAMSFDEILNTRLPNEVIDICKVDVEGAEYDIFLTGPCASLDRVRYLLMEVHGVDQSGSRQPELIDSILARGFSEIGRTQTSGDCFVVLFSNDRID